MQNLLYYPNFEIQDMNFLKFALIYIDRIHPIIPTCALDSLSNEMKDIMKYTDLMEQLEPSYPCGELASRAAMEFLERNIRYDEYDYRFINAEKKQREDKKDFILYGEKYTNNFEHYCLEKGLGRRCDEGIMISQDVAYSYMCILADIMSKEMEMDMITDRIEYADSGLIMSNRIYREMERQPGRRLSEIRREIEFQIPVDIRKIPLETFIKLREDKQFNDARRCFTKELDNVLDMQDIDPDHVDLYNYINCKNEIWALLKNFFCSSAALVVAVHSFRNACVDLRKPLDFFGNGCNGAVNLAILKKQVKYGKEYIKELGSKKQARRYLANLRRIGLGRL